MNEKTQKPIIILSSSGQKSLILKSKIYDHFSHLITSSQHGFLRGKSTCTQLLSVFHDINYSLDSGTQTDVIYLDFSKAFDSVPHSLLCSKLKHFGFSGNLHAWFTSYLKNRKQRVSIEGVSSDWLPLRLGSHKAQF